jgi:hypothetical protein
MRRKAFLVSVATFALLSIAQAQEWNKTYNVSGKPTLRIETNDGRVHVASSSTKQVMVRLSAHGYRPDQVRVIEHQSGDRVEVVVRVVQPHIQIGFSNRGVEIEATVPVEADLDVHTRDGRIEVDRVKGDLRLNSGDGRIDGTLLDGNVHASTNDGRLTLDGRFDQLEARTKDGSIHIAARPGSKMASSWSVRTNDGRIELRVPADLDAYLDAHTRDGHIDLNVPIEVSGRLDRSTVRGKMNGGGPTLEIYSGDGSIMLDKL